MPPSVIPKSSEPTTRWKAKYPDFAVHDGVSIAPPSDGSLPGSDSTRRTGGRWDPDSQSWTGVETSAVEWIDAPPTSNLHSFMFISARVGSRYYDRLQKIQGQSMLHCRFKPKEKDPTVRHYTYRFPNDADGEAIFEAMKTSPHPWGEVGYPRLVLGKVPYTRHA